MSCVCACRADPSNTIPPTCQDWWAGTTWKTPWPRWWPGRLAGALPAEARLALVAFRPLAHRMEMVGELDGVSSTTIPKAPTWARVVAAIDRFPRPVVLIAGGRDKGGSYEPLAQVMNKPVAARC